MASRWTSRVLVPYSSSYSTLIVSEGSLPSLRTGTKPASRCSAIGALKMKPRDSMPTTTSTRSSLKGSVISSMASRKAAASRSRVVMS